MKTKGYKTKAFSVVGAIIFFAIIAFVMQIAILVYDYISERTESTAHIAILILILIFILAAICTAIDIIRRKLMVDRPVRKILSATEKIAKGDFSARVDIQHTYDRYDEYDLISENLNTMAAELSKSEMLKNDFISNVSHELKTPLAVINSYASALREETLDTDAREKYLDALVSASYRLTDLITNILQLNKLENQELIPEISRINLCDALGEAVLGFEDILEKKEITLECDLEDVFINSSPALLEIVFSNLISNALKFTNPGGYISVTLTQTDTHASVSVSDTGCGMSKEVGQRIFEKFYQGDTSHSSEGNGLGLALVKKVIDILGGEISVSSEVGVGSTFTVVLKKD